MNNYTSKVLRATLIFATAIQLASCTNTVPETEKELKEQKEAAYSDEDNKKSDAQFLMDAALLNRKGIRLGELAQEKSKIKEVKALGKMMEAEHGKSLADLEALAKAKNISLPTAPSESDEDTYKTLTRKAGIGFGNEYSTMMVNEHKNAIALFENAAVNCTDPDIKKWAKTTLPVLKEHLENSLHCQETCAKM